jgi:pimeloyl-ACP methyl ester carboxylesterase
MNNKTSVVTYGAKLFSTLILQLLLRKLISRFQLRPLPFLAFCVWIACCMPARASQAIDSMERINLGGLDQSILIRGRDITKPLLLFLHGGPGIPEMPISYVNRDLERDFVVVQWDQRGAGKSYQRGIPLSRMHLENFVGDTEQLTRYLLRRFHQKKLYLVGYSWGTLVGALTVARSPELFHAYVGISQFVNVDRSSRRLYKEGLNRARKQGDEAALKKLIALGPPPYANSRDHNAFEAIKASLVSGKVLHPLSTWHYAALALISPYYGVADDVRLAEGRVFSGVATHDDLYNANLLDSVPELDVPVYIFEGRYDTILSPSLSEEYFETLRAPRGKHLVWFEHSDHSLHVEEREKYRAMMREVLRENQMAGDDGWSGTPGL